MAMKSLKQMLKPMTCEWGKPPTLLFQFNPPLIHSSYPFFFIRNFWAPSQFVEDFFAFQGARVTSGSAKFVVAASILIFLSSPVRTTSQNPGNNPTHAMNFKMKFMQHDLRGPGKTSETA